MRYTSTAISKDRQLISKAEMDTQIEVESCTRHRRSGLVYQMSMGLQVYAAGRGKAPLRVYNLRYKDSFEQDRYMAALQREQRVFEDLIHSKGHMVLPELGQVRPCAPATAGSRHVMPTHLSASIEIGTRCPGWLHYFVIALQIGTSLRNVWH